MKTGIEQQKKDSKRILTIDQLYYTEKQEEPNVLN